MDEYFKALIEQYKNATGNKIIDLKSKDFIVEFTSWIKSRQDMGETYIELLDYLGLFDSYDDERTIEVGKGAYDSLAIPHKCGIITPYTDSFAHLPNERMHISNFEVYAGIPYLETNSYILGYKELEDIPLDFTFATHNPYETRDIRNWHQLHNNGQSRIIVGMFGNLSDIDRIEKLAALKNLSNKLDGFYKEEYATVGDNYFYAVGSRRYIKQKELVKTL